MDFIVEKISPVAHEELEVAHLNRLQKSNTVTPTPETSISTIVDSAESGIKGIYNRLPLIMSYLLDIDLAL